LRLILAFRCLFAILFKGALSDELAAELGLFRRGAARPAPAPSPAAVNPSDGALQILAILQRDSRLIDFLMEDIAAYSDDQVGAAVRSLHDQCREALARYVQLAPVIDGVEGTFTRLASIDPASVKLLGNVPPQPPAGGLLRHRGWRCVKVELPALHGKQDAKVIAPAEVEIE
jgi:Domain of unknown function (DUF2760)